jgi:hypothetical protein
MYPAEFQQAENGYFEAAFFTEHEPGFEPEEFDQDFLIDAKRDVARFLRCARKLDLLPSNSFDYAQLGRDFWLTRNGHGAGFWDRPEIWGEEESEKLSELASRFGPVDFVFCET